MIRPVAGVLAVSLALAGVISWAQRGVADETVAPVDASAWKILFTGDTRGYIHPCGCDEGLFGGLPRRATYLSKARRPQDLLLDLGNLIEGTRPHDRLKLSYLLEGLKRLAYDVLVPDERELALREAFETVARSLDRPHVICTNLVRAGTNARVFEPFHVKQLPDGTRVAIVGLKCAVRKAVEPRSQRRFLRTRCRAPDDHVRRREISRREGRAGSGEGVPGRGPRPGGLRAHEHKEL